MKRKVFDVRLEKETLWMDAHQMARLFGRDRSVIVRHIRKIYETKELDQTSTCAKNAQVAADGKLRQMDLYNLDVIIRVGYRVKLQAWYAVPHLGYRGFAQTPDARAHD